MYNQIFFNPKSAQNTAKNDINVTFQFLSNTVCELEIMHHSHHEGWINVHFVVDIRFNNYISIVLYIKMRIKIGIHTYLQ